MLIMHWQRGFKRIQLVGTVALGLGVVLLASVILTQSLSYAPNPGFAQMYAALWPLALMFIVLGVLLWASVWVLSGFVPDSGNVVQSISADRARFRQGN